MPPGEASQEAVQPPTQIKHISSMQRSKTLGEQQPSWTHTSAAMPGCSSWHMGPTSPSQLVQRAGRQMSFWGQGGGKKGVPEVLWPCVAQLLSSTKT